MDESTAPHVDPLRLLRRVASHWKLIVLIFFAVAAPVAVWALVFQPKTYEAKATIFIEDQKKGGGSALVREWVPPSDASFQLAILRSRSLAERVVESLSTQATEELLGRSMKRDYLLEAQNAVRLLLGYEPVVQGSQQRILTELQRARVRFNSLPSGEVEINAVAYQPRVAMELANAYVEVLQTRSQSYTREEARSTREFIEKFLNQTRVTLKESEEALARFQRAGGPITPSQRAGLDLTKLAQIEDTLAEVQASKQIATVRLNYLKGGKDATGKPLPSATKVTAQQLRDRMAQLEEKLSGLLEKYTEQHPMVISTQGELRQIQGKLSATLGAARSAEPGPIGGAGLESWKDWAKQMTDLEVEVSSLEAKEEVLKQRISNLSRNLSFLSTEERQGMELVRKVESQRTLYGLLSERLGTARIQEQAQARGLRVIDLAALPKSPNNSTINLTILLGILLGLGLGGGVATLIEYFNQPIESEDQLALMTGLPVLGWLPLVEDIPRRRDRVQEPLSFVESPSQRALPAEGCRSIRTSLESLGRSQMLRTIMLTSAGPREGKSTIVLNLGWAFSELGHRLILVDSDLRRPALHRAFRLSPQSGLTDLLTAEASWDQVKRPIKGDFTFLSAGTTKTANPGAVLSPERLRVFLDFLKDRADVVLFDSAPVLAVSDNLILASMVDGVILVVRAGHTQRRDLIRAKDQLEKVGARLVGIVINQVSPRETRRYYHRYGDYYASAEGFPPRKSLWNPRSWWPRRSSRHSEEMAGKES